jgi:filamentous hemagglutinin family protein
MKNEPVDLAKNLRRSAVALAVATCFSVQVAYANPTKPVVVNGAASFAQNGNLFTVTNSPNAIINWGSFSIGTNEITRFIQQSNASAVLNRVTGQNPSSILGALQSNGRVFLINPNGIVFGAGSQIDVGGLVASTLNLSNADFLAGRMRFTDGLGNSVINNGNITTPQGGNVHLIGNAVTNNGIITSPKGEVILAAGNSVELVNPGTPNLRVEVSAPDNQARNLGQIVADSGRIGIYAGLINHSGTINANSVEVDQSGQIILKATKNATLEATSTTTANGPTGGKIEVQSGDTTLVSGTLEVKGTAGKGGQINVLGNFVGLTGSANLNASGETGGGTVLVGGDFQGKNTNIKNAFRTYVGPETTIKADAITNGDGGKVIVWADDVTRYYGSISARGGSQSGNGGFVETSGKEYLEVRGSVNASAPKGSPGQWLLDPHDITIDSSGPTSGGSALPNFDASADNAVVLDSDITAALSGGTSVNITTGSTGTQNGDITVAPTADLNWLTTNRGTTLTLNANRHVNVQADISGTLSAGGGAGPTQIVLTAGGTVTVDSGKTVSYFGNDSAGGAGNVDIIVNANNINISGTLVAQTQTGNASVVLRKSLGVPATSITVDGGAVTAKATISGSALIDLSSTGAMLVNNSTLTAEGPTSAAVRLVTATGNITLTNANVNATNFNSAGTTEITLKSNNGGNISIGNSTVKADGFGQTEIDISTTSGSGTIDITGSSVEAYGGGDAATPGAPSFVHVNAAGTVNLGAGTLIEAGAGSIFPESTEVVVKSLNGSIATAAQIVSEIEIGSSPEVAGSSGAITLEALNGSISSSGGFLKVATNGAATLSHPATITLKANNGIGATGAPLRIYDGFASVSAINGTGGGIVLSQTTGDVLASKLTATNSSAGALDIQAEAGSIVVPESSAIDYLSGPVILRAANFIATAPAGLGLAGRVQAGGDITLIANDMDFRGPVIANTGNGAISSQTTTAGRTIDFGPFTSGTVLSLDGTDVNQLSAATLTIGNSGNPITASGNVVFNANTGVTLNGSSVNQTGGAITQAVGTGSITVNTGAGAITLNGANNFSTLNLTGGTVQVTEVDASTMVLNASGTTTINRGGNLTVSGNTAGLDISSGAPGSTLSFGTTNVTGNLDASSSGLISQTGPLTVTGASTITAANAGTTYPITLTHSLNDFQGTATFIGGQGGTIQVNDKDALTAVFGVAASATEPIATVTAGGNLIVSGQVSGLTTTTTNGGTTSFGTTNVFNNGALDVTSAGAVTQTGGISINGTGTANINAGTNDITLTSATNNFFGTVALTGGAVQINSANATFTLGAVTAGSLQATATAGTVAAGGPIVSGGAVTLTGSTGVNVNSTITAGGDMLLDAQGASANVAIAGSISKTTGADATLEVRAGNGITFSSGADVTSTSGKLNVILNSDRDASGGGAIALGSGTVITSNGGNITLGGGANPLTTSAIATVGDIAGVHISGAQLNAGAGNINIRGEGPAVAADNSGVRLDNSTVVSTTSGGITIVGLGTAGSLEEGRGIRLDGAGTKITSASGAISLTGTGGASGAGFNSGIGVEISGGAAIESTGAATITVTGTGGIGSGGDDIGIVVRDSGSKITSVNGDIALAGTGGSATSGSGSRDYGIVIQGGAVVESTGVAKVTLTGIGGNSVGFGDNHGIYIEDAGTVVRTAAGELKLDGTGRGQNSHNMGVLISTGAVVESTGVGAVTIVGTGAATGTTNNEGVAIQDAGTKVAASTGLISITGTGGAASSGMNIAGGATINSTGGGDILLKSLGGVIDLGAASGGVDLVSTTGNVTFDSMAGATQNATGKIVAGGLRLLGSGTFTLDQAANDVTTLAANLTGTTSLTYRDANAVSIGTVLGTNGVNVSGPFTLNTAGNVSQTSPIIVSGVSTINAGSGTITLANSGNDFQGPLALTGSNVTVNDANALQLSNSNVSGTLGVTSNGLIDQTGGSALNVSGTSSFNSNGNAITLANAGNDFVGAATLTGSNVSVQDANALAVVLNTTGTNTLTAGGDIGATGSFGNLTASATGAGAGVNASSSTNLTINSVTVNGGAVSLASTGGNLDLNGNISGAGTLATSASGTQTLSSGTISATDYTLGGGGMTLAGGTLSISNLLTVLSGATLTNQAGATSAVNAGNADISGILNPNGGTVAIANVNIKPGGLLKGVGTVGGNVNNDGSVSPGNSPGILTVTGNYVQGPTGVLNIDIGGTTAGSQYDQLQVGGTASLNGTLNATLVSGFVPASSDVFNIIQSSGATSGTFSTTNLPAAPALAASYLSSGVDLVNAPVPPVLLGSVTGGLVATILIPSTELAPTGVLEQKDIFPSAGQGGTNAAGDKQPPVCN